MWVILGPIRLVSIAMERVFSGIQPTNAMHLGNALGAVQNWVALQDQHDSMYCVVDLHAMTVPFEPSVLLERSRSTGMLLMAWGIDPTRSTVFIQSHVREHAELAWILNCIASFGELNRMTQFKDKSHGRDSVSVGLFSYPVLMAADILLYRSTHVPVGDDQRQHLELARDIAQRANARFGEIFVVPEPLIPPVGARIMDLAEPTQKMSKTGSSPNGVINVLDDPKVISKRIRSAVTDSGTGIHFDPQEKPGVSNLLSILAAVTGSTVSEVALSFDGTQYGPLKQAVADAVVEYLAPVQSRYAELARDPAEVDRILRAGAGRAQERAEATMLEVRAHFGIG